ncbi:hypothetical protein [Archaeoglobus sp.]
MKNLEFRKKLRAMLEDDFEDEEIIKYVLNFAWDQYPRPLLVWLLAKIGQYGYFL